MRSPSLTAVAFSIVLVTWLGGVDADAHTGANVLLVINQASPASVAPPELRGSRGAGGSPGDCARGRATLLMLRIVCWVVR